LAYNYRGQVKIIQKEYVEAIADLENAHALDSTRPDNHYSGEQFAFNLLHKGNCFLRAHLFSALHG